MKGAAKYGTFNPVMFLMKKKAMKNKKEGREWGENERSKKEGSSFYRLTP